MPDRAVPFVNTHSDYPMHITRRRRCYAESVLRDGYLQTQRDVNLQMEVMTVATDHRFPIHGGILDMSEPRTVMEMIDHVHMEMSESPEDYGLVLDAADIDRHVNAGRIAIMLNLEGVACVEDDFGLWRTYYRNGVRALSLTHDPQNMMASGCREPDAGLTRLGRSFVKYLNEFNVVLDLVHAGERSFFTALEEYDGMVVVSHSNAKAVWDCPRNLTDAQIMAVAERGGFIAPMFSGGFLRRDGENATLDDIVAHVDYIAGLAGIDHVALGPDWIDYLEDFFPDLIKPFGIEPAAVRWVEAADRLSRIQNVADALSRRGYSDDDVAKVMGQNALRCYRTILARHPSAGCPGMRYQVEGRDR